MKLLFARRSLLLIASWLALIPGCSNDAAPPAQPTQPEPSKSATTRPLQPKPKPPHPPSNAPLTVTKIGLDSPMPEPTVAAPQLVRPSMKVRELSADNLRQQGLELIEIPALRLVTDLPSETHQPLTQLVPGLLAALTEYFGELPQAEDRTPYLMTGYVMSDRELFAKAGLVQDGTLLDYHGRTIGAEFWMNNQSLDYYRSHLFAHEITHVFMKHLPGEAQDLPYWYLEGMAELFGTHSRSRTGDEIRFNVMPERRDDFRGWERIELLRRDLARRGMRSIREITELGADDFFKVESYAWCWALCRFLDSHPSYRERFRQLAKSLPTHPFVAHFEQLFKVDASELEADWMLFAHAIEFSHDFERSVVTFVPGRDLTEPTDILVDSQRGWQSTALKLEAGRRYRIRAVGQVTVAQEPRPWRSEANGVSIRYVRGQPLGRLLGAIRFEGTAEQAARSMLKEIPLGNDVEFTPELPGTLYLRLNDSLAELADNDGDLRVTISSVGN